MQKQQNWASAWEDRGMEDWSWNHLFGGLIVHVDPLSLEEVLNALDLSRDAEIKEFFVERFLKDNTILDPRLLNLLSLIPNSAVFELNLNEFVRGYLGSAGISDKQLEEGLQYIMTEIKLSALCEASILLRLGITVD